MKQNPFDILNEVKLDLVKEEKVCPKRKIIPLVDPNLAVKKGFTHQTPRFSKKEVLVFRLEDSKPTVSEAQRLLRTEFKRHQGTNKLLRIIHGYGSSGQGGALAEAMPRLLTEFVNMGVIKSFLLGEQFIYSNAKCNELTSRYSFLKKDSDYGKMNRGISLVEL